MKKINLDRNWTVSLRREWWEKAEKQTIDLPHDASIGLDRRPDAPSGAGGGYFPGVNLVYEKQLETDPLWQDKRVWLTFEGVYQMAEVRVNGQLAGRQHYGYTSFHVDATPYLRPSGTNQIKVLVSNTAQPNSRWYTGSGIYRHVWLTLLDTADIEPWDCFVSTADWTKQQATVAVRASLADRREHPRTALTVRAEVLDPDGQRAASAVTELVPTGNPDAKIPLAFDLVIRKPASWSPETPSLYRLRLLLEGASGPVLLQEIPVGIREIRLSAGQGLTLNGQPIKLRGGCIHHDNGPLGAASFDRAEERKVLLLKKAGYNAVRCAHNPPAPAFLDACDRLGLLVMDEIFDCWQEGKNPYDYHMVFDRDWQKDLEAMVLRDRNHPSVIIWSTGNEIPERDGRSQGYAWAERLAGTVRRLDPTRPVTNALNGLSAAAIELNNLESNLIKTSADHDYWGERTAPFVKPLDIVGYNYLLQRYAPDTVAFPERLICGAESFPLEAAANWRAIEQMPHVIGDFVWTALDYLGEAGLGHVWYDDNPAFLGRYPWHLANCGDYDICGFERPQLALRRQLWNSDSKPYLAVLRPDRDQARAKVSAWGWPEVLPFWDWADHAGKTVQVVVYARAPEVRLSLNGRELGRRPCGQEQGCQCSFEVPYEPGRLLARTYDGDTLLEETALETPGPACSLRLASDQSALRPDGTDLAYVTVELVDERGNRVRLADRPVTVAVSGSGCLQVLGSADPCSEEPYRGSQRRSFEGRLLAVVRSGSEPGEILVTAVAEGLEPAQLRLKNM